MANWIICKERMPETEKEHLLLATVKIGEFMKDISKVDSYYYLDEHRPAFIKNDSYGHICAFLPSYWMELPEMPEGVTAL